VIKLVLKTFNVEEKTYGKFSKFCKEQGISMSKQVEIFMETVMEDEPQAKEDYFEKLSKIREQKSIKIGNLGDFKKRYGIE
jgi:intergrase/recombinase